MSKNWLAIISLGALIFGVLGGVGFCFLIRYPDRIDYIQQVAFDKLSVLTLAFLIAGILFGIISLCFSIGKSEYFTKSIMGLCLSLIVLLAMFSTPRLLVKSVLTAQNICINNVREIEAAKADWTQKNSATNGAALTWNDIAPYFPNGFPKCPEGGTYTLGRVGEPVLCSIPSHRLPSQINQ